MTTKNSHMVNLRLPDAYPLTGTECRVLLLKAPLFYQAVKDNEVATFFKYNPEVEAILHKLETNPPVPPE